MSSTISPTPPRFPKQEGIVHIVCDYCGKSIALTVQANELFLRFREITLPEEWRHVLLEGWVGTFHACSDECEEQLKVAARKS